MDEEVESTLPFTFRDLIYALCKKSRRSPRALEENYENCLSTSVLQLVNDVTPVFYGVGFMAGIRYMLLGRKITKKRHHMYDYLYDFRFAEHQDYNDALSPLYITIDMDTGSLATMTQNRENVPPLTYFHTKRGGISASLWDILQLPQCQGQAEPQSPEELKQVLVDHDLYHNISVTYCVNLKQDGMHPFLSKYPTTPEEGNAHALLKFWAYPKSAATIGYAFKQPPKKTDPMSLMYYVTPEQDIPDRKSVV